MIEYLDYESDSFDPTNGFNSALRKRREYEYEHEVRIIQWPAADLAKRCSPPITTPIGRFDSHLAFEKAKPPGVLLPVDLDALSPQIIVSPFAPHWYFESVQYAFRAISPCTPVARSSIEYEEFDDSMPITQADIDAVLGVMQTHRFEPTA